MNINILYAIQIAQSVGAESQFDMKHMEWGIEDSR